VLVLTKPLGTGVITTAAKGGAASAADLAGAVRSMMRLNRRAAEALGAGAVHACTDITGFGLAGHVCEMLEPGATRIRIAAGALPFLDGARAYAEDFLFPEGAGRNECCYGGRVRVDPAVPEFLRTLLFSPETSGGLLAAVPPGEVDALRARMHAAGESLWAIGEVLAGEGVEVAP
ncbi:MAG TPA: selenide, water dikinase SelD, partial [Planctomycetes bacterium]|nr:selenide, water dikinase SelD [Planctomycetota bacterium]